MITENAQDPVKHIHSFGIHVKYSILIFIFDEMISAPYLNKVSTQYFMTANEFTN